MTLLGEYAAVAVVVALAALAAAGRLRDPDRDPDRHRPRVGPDGPGLTALLAGLLWPVVAVGILQALIVVVVQRALRPSPTPAGVRHLRPAATVPSLE